LDREGDPLPLPLINTRGGPRVKKREGGGTTF